MPRSARVSPGGMVFHVINRDHWHLVLWLQNDGDLARFMQRLTLTHVTRWQKNYNMVGFGHVYQGRFKSFPVAVPRKWLQYVNAPASDGELTALGKSCVRGVPYGSRGWVEKTAVQLGLEASLSAPGRPKKR